ncbi:MAG: ABC transporter substrate-binding protein [Oscillospiraceae bacterium]|nr:ABC transporter substrate-binding protein [Oscillospiraceae bacterium]
MNKVKRTLAVLSAAAIMASLAACGSSGTNTSGSTNTSTGDKTYTIGICQLVQHPALDAATQGFEDALTEKLGDKVTFDLQNAANDSATCSTICTSFVSSGYDLILANATSSLQAAVSATSDIPILGTSITDYGTALGVDNWTGTSGTNVSGTSDLAPLDGQANMLNELFPDAKNVGIIYCSGEPNSKYQVDTITPYLEAFGYKVTPYTFADSNDVSAVTTSACNDSDVIYIPTDNTAASCSEAINNVAIKAKVPIIAGEEGICKGCGVATLSISYYDLGYKTGEMAYDILVNGADITTMEVQYAPSFTKEYNATICQTLGITPPSDYVAIAD